VAGSIARGRLSSINPSPPLSPFSLKNAPILSPLTPTVLRATREFTRFPVLFFALFSTSLPFVQRKQPPCYLAVSSRKMPISSFSSLIFSFDERARGQYSFSYFTLAPYSLQTFSFFFFFVRLIPRWRLCFHLEVIWLPTLLSALIFFYDFKALGFFSLLLWPPKLSLFFFGIVVPPYFPFTQGGRWNGAFLLFATLLFDGNRLRSFWDSTLWISKGLFGRPNTPPSLRTFFQLHRDLGAVSSYRWKMSLPCRSPYGF